MRIFLLRLILGWWMILVIWSFLWLLWWLLGGAKEATCCAIWITKIIWFGGEKCQ